MRVRGGAWQRVDRVHVQGAMLLGTAETARWQPCRAGVEGSGKQRSPAAGGRHAAPSRRRRWQAMRGALPGAKCGCGCALPRLPDTHCRRAQQESKLERGRAGCRGVPRAWAGVAVLQPCCSAPGGAGRAGRQPLLPGQSNGERRRAVQLPELAVSAARCPDGKTDAPQQAKPLTAASGAQHTQQFFMGPCLLSLAEHSIDHSWAACTCWPQLSQREPPKQMLSACSSLPLPLAALPAARHSSRVRSRAMQQQASSRSGIGPAAAAPRAAVAAAASSSSGDLPPQTQQQQKAQLRTCRRCKQQFDPSTNGPASCRYHSALWTGGEVGKARARARAVPALFAAVALLPTCPPVLLRPRPSPLALQAYGFCRASARPEDQLGAVMGRTGLVRFWDCCGSEQEDAPGCCTGRHVTYDDPLD